MPNAATAEQKPANFAFDSLQAIRNRLLDLTSRNRLLNYRHGSGGFIRVIDELPDQLAADILKGDAFAFIPVDEPKLSELIEHGYIAINDEGEEVKLKADPSAKEWASIKGLKSSFELPSTTDSNEAKHNDTNIQTLLYPRELEAQLRNIRSRANTALEETGANILYFAIGFLQWNEDNNIEQTRQAPLYLIPVRVTKAALNRDLGTYVYHIQYTGDEIISNLSLREKLRCDFQLELPELEEGHLPEAYIQQVANQLLTHKSRWQIKRFASLAMFDFSKLLMYLDLDPANWPQDESSIHSHPIVKQFFGHGDGAHEDTIISSFAYEHAIDELPDVHQRYPLIDDADSSQHSALVDAIEGENLVIEGPPGSGKSQTITNLIAAAIAQGKSVLFVAEKMAALQVVHARLQRAGLGDFCLELHSHNSQKKQVYQNIADRIGKQQLFSYPTAIDLEIQLYEEKKLALSNYADLINSHWKQTAKTIHQIFSTATLLRQTFTEVPLDVIQPGLINGDNFDELTERKTCDALNKYASVYEQVKQQLGNNSDLSEHPWFGVTNQSIQPFDAEEVIALLQQWQQSIKQLCAALAPVNQQLDSTDTIEDLPALQQLLSDMAQLPAIQGTEDFEALKNINDQHRVALTSILNDYQTAKQLLAQLDQQFDLAELSAKPDITSLYDTCNSLVRSCHQTQLTLAQLYSRWQTVAKLQTLSVSLTEDLTTLKVQDPTISNLLTSNFVGFKSLQTYLSHIKALDPLLISRRHNLFDNDLLDKHLPDLTTLIDKIRPLQNHLSEAFQLDQLPSSKALKGIRQIIGSAGLFRWFSRDWHNAKNELLSCATGFKPKLKVLVRHLDDLIRYQQLVEKLHSEPAYPDLLAHEFNGINTPVAELVPLRQWYQRVRRSYGIGFGKEVVFATSLFSLSDDIFKGLRHMAESRTLDDLAGLFNVHLQLEETFIDPLLDHQSLLDQTAISLFSTKIAKLLQQLQHICKKDFPLGKLQEGLEQLENYLILTKTLANNTVISELFGEHSVLSLSDNSTRVYDNIQATLSLSLAINELQSSALKQYLNSHISTENIARLSDNIQTPTRLIIDCNEAKQVFAQRVLLDEFAWLTGCNGNFKCWIKRNESAISQPQWLSSWVDFIHVRGALANQGLEQLLQFCGSTNDHLTQKCNISQIETIFSYCAHEILAREILHEMPQLAFFSGADHDGVRRQFSEYDSRLKQLQREKIAYQVAEIGYANILPGVTTGRVSNLSEMGLINNEIGKKTRHVPLRQLIKRAGKSLVALKPCFLMGTHSVAQYLAPGEVQFDLVIMDEASQIKPEDALGSIARGKQLVVVGDPKQLPPTSFFNKTVATEEEDNTAIESSESILDAALPLFTARRLRWHYRSRHESLIAFSNQTFYDNNLVLFPSPRHAGEEFGIKFTLVKRGRFVNQRNIEEAQIVAQAVRQHLLHRANESLGVVAMSATQREQIERCVEELAKEDPYFNDALVKNATTEEPMFLKNLENVQGDERDVIFISCTYGPQVSGGVEMPQRFGPINSSSGDRRLNVLFTRSKKRMHIFSSMTASHIVIKQHSGAGVRALKHFLEYAQNGRMPASSHQVTPPQNDFADAVTSALQQAGYDCEPHVGVAGYFIDLAVKDPNQPNSYLMGIECDGPTYYTGNSVRDRDRLRQAVLENLGWTIKRIWSTPWYKNPDGQLQPIINQLHQLKAEAAKQRSGETDIEAIELMIQHEESVHQVIQNISGSSNTLAAKLQAFDQYLSQIEVAVPTAVKLLRPAMINALSQLKPVTKNEFVEVIPAYLYKATSAAQEKYLEHVLRIIAEHEVESEFA